MADRLNCNLDPLDTLFNNNTVSVTTAFDIDCAMDKNDNLHIEPFYADVFSVIN